MYCQLLLFHKAHRTSLDARSTVQSHDGVVAVLTRNLYSSCQACLHTRLQVTRLFTCCDHARRAMKKGKAVPAHSRVPSKLQQPCLQSAKLGQPPATPSARAARRPARQTRCASSPEQRQDAVGTNDLAEHKDDIPRPARRTAQPSLRASPPRAGSHEHRHSTLASKRARAATREPPNPQRLPRDLVPRQPVPNLGQELQRLAGRRMAEAHQRHRTRPQGNRR